MRYIPTFNTDIDAQIEHNRKLIMDLPKNAVDDEIENSRFTARGPGSIGEPWCKLEPLF